MSAEDPFAPKSVREQADEAEVKAQEARAHADYMASEADAVDTANALENETPLTSANIVAPVEHRVIVNG